MHQGEADPLGGGLSLRGITEDAEHGHDSFFLGQFHRRECGHLFLQHGVHRACVFCQLRSNVLERHGRTLQRSLVDGLGEHGCHQAEPRHDHEAAIISLSRMFMDSRLRG